ncbi:hypothetical protein [Croceicoccus marinus]|uniref:Uncharacterized protein n=1 Tax=Croceicoccus marinus TaxID=450378 RepID=A0A1Z1FGT0_9SPHN|nr:hypothetical protein [Croceicoccus marinus]ARU18009.1 hypothetical protein A9D14_17020 [Croceicoccus marinus]QNE07514.1 hypothetical protein H4O24_16745 [Croceicoccus marinus]
MRAAASWVLRHFALFLLLAAAIALFQSGMLSGSCRDCTVGDWASASEVREQIERAAREGRAELDANLAEFEDWGEERRREEIARRRERLAELRAALADGGGLFDRYRPGKIVERYRMRLEQAVLEREIAVLEARIDLGTLEQAGAIMVPTPQAIAAARRRCAQANRAVREFNAQARAEKWIRNRIADEAERLTQNARTRCERAGELARQREAGRQQASERAARLREARERVDAEATSARQALARVDTPEARNMLADIAVKAALALLAIIALPYLIRCFLYFVLAPLAQRRGAIRIPLLAGTASRIALPGPSSVSLSVRLEEGEELLVRQGYLQTSSAGGDKATRWLLDPRHFLSSIASGLVFLTRMRGAGEATTISATRDGFAELTEIALPPGGACILHPRALVAVVQPQGRPIPIRSHWRLFSLNAWLTLQLRFFSFHGPGRLIVKGGRGVRVERAEQGRIFAQDQLVGFSADLAYSVTRTETFAPYFFGQEPLLKDKVEAGRGILVIEEAPLSMRSGKVRGGLEGMIDAGLKAFGL